MHCAASYCGGRLDGFCWAVVTEAKVLLVPRSPALTSLQHSGYCTCQ